MLLSKHLPVCLASLALAGLSFAQTPDAAPAAKSAEEKPATPKPATSRKPVTFNISMRDGLRFDPPRVSAKAGDEIVVNLENADSTHQMHNFLVLQPGKLQVIVQAAMDLGENGPAKGFIPQSPEIIVHSAVLDPEGKTVVKFKLPDAPAVYPYVCTMPGHGMVMYGAIYADVPMPPLAKDPNIPPTAVQAMVAGGGRRPFVQRMFVPDAGPAAIAVALQGDQNFVWDAGQCRLRYAWNGGFIDASDYWRGNGRDLAKLLGEPWWNAPIDEFPIRIGDGKTTPKIKFLGYKLEKGLPEFHYRVDETEVFEKITEGKTHGSLSLHYRIPKLAKPLTYRAADSNFARWSSSVGAFKDGALTLTPAQAAAFTLTLTSASH